MGILTIIALSAITLMNPPMQIDWATAVVQIGAEEQADEARCGIESASGKRAADRLSRLRRRPSAREQGAWL